MTQLLQTIHWPDVIAGTVITAILGALGFGLKMLVQFSITRHSLIKYGKGIWYSAEYDPKGNVSRDRRVTYLKVLVAPTFRGHVRVKSIEQLNPEEKTAETGWIVNGRIEHGTLLGEWRTTIKNTVRFGTAMLRFMDNGRAVGYWIGVRGYDPPLYGYWIMSRDFDDLKRIIATVAPPGTFQTVDIARRVADVERGTRGSKI